MYFVYKNHIKTRNNYVTFLLVSEHREEKTEHPQGQTKTFSEQSKVWLK